MRFTVALRIHCGSLDDTVCRVQLPLSEPHGNTPLSQAPATPGRRYFDYVNFNATGYRPYVTTLYAVLLGCARKTISRVLVLIVSMGYGVVLPYLGAIQYKVCFARMAPCFSSCCAAPQGCSSPQGRHAPWCCVLWTCNVAIPRPLLGWLCHQPAFVALRGPRSQAGC